MTLRVTKLQEQTRSVQGGIPTQSVGTINQSPHI